jgi:hypothetical protein
MEKMKGIGMVGLIELKGWIPACAGMTGKNREKGQKHHEYQKETFLRVGPIHHLTATAIAWRKRYADNPPSAPPA